MTCPIILPVATLRGLHKSELRSDAQRGALCHSARQLQSVAADAFVGQKDGEARSLAGGALHLDLAVVRLHDPGDEAEAEAEALFGAGRGALAGDAVEAVEDVRQVLGR